MEENIVGGGAVLFLHFADLVTSHCQSRGRHSSDGWMLSFHVWNLFVPRGWGSRTPFTDCREDQEEINDKPTMSQSCAAKSQAIDGFVWGFPSSEQGLFQLLMTHLVIYSFMPLPWLAFFDRVPRDFCPTLSHGISTITVTILSWTLASITILKSLSINEHQLALAMLEAPCSNAPTRVPLHNPPIFQLSLYIVVNLPDGKHVVYIMVNTIVHDS